MESSGQIYAKAGIHWIGGWRKAQPDWTIHETEIPSRVLWFEARIVQSVTSERTFKYVYEFNCNLI